MQQQSRAKQLKAWRVKNPEKVKSHAKKASRNYYLKHAEEKKSNYKSIYHESAIIDCVPFLYNISINGTYHEVTADHEFFDDMYRPRTLWRHPISYNITKQQIQTNINYVIRLQRKGIIPNFLLSPVETYLLWLEIRNESETKASVLQATKREEWDQIIEQLDREANENHIKIVNENYTKHLQKINH